MFHLRRAIPAVLILLFAFVVVGQPSIRVPFTRTETMITMRDGIRFHTVILTPQTRTEPLPILIDRTPYGVNEWNSDLVNNVYKEFVADGYIFVFQDIHGKFGSEGQFVMVRPPRAAQSARSERQRLRFSERPSHHGPGPEHVVSFV